MIGASYLFLYYLRLSSVPQRENEFIRKADAILYCIAPCSELMDSHTNAAATSPLPPAPPPPPLSPFPESSVAPVKHVTCALTNETIHLVHTK